MDLPLHLEDKIVLYFFFKPSESVPIAAITNLADFDFAVYFITVCIFFLLHCPEIQFLNVSYQLSMPIYRLKHSKLE